MNLGTQTASVTNHLMSRSTLGEPLPEVGMGATLLAWTDRHAATITEVIYTRGGMNIVRVQRDRAVPKHQRATEDQKWEYSRDPLGTVHYFRKDKSGRWREVSVSDAGRWVFRGSYGLAIGYRSEYRDPSF